MPSSILLSDFPASPATPLHSIYGDERTIKNARSSVGGDFGFQAILTSKEKQQLPSLKAITLPVDGNRLPFAIPTRREQLRTAMPETSDGGSDSSFEELEDSFEELELEDRDLGRLLSHLPPIASSNVEISAHFGDEKCFGRGWRGSLLACPDLQAPARRTWPPPKTSPAKKPRRCPPVPAPSQLALSATPAGCARMVWR